MHFERENANHRVPCGPLEANCHLCRLHGGEWCVSRHGRHMAQQIPCVQHHENGLSSGMRGEWKNKERRARTIVWGGEEEDGCWASSVHGQRKEKEPEN